MGIIQIRKVKIRKLIPLPTQVRVVLCSAADDGNSVTVNQLKSEK